MTVSDLLALARENYAGFGYDASPAEIEFVVSHVSGVPRSRLLVDREMFLPDLSAAIQMLVGRRAGGEPLQYVLGSWDFYGREFLLSPATLIPRPETEQMVEGIVDRWRASARKIGRIIDIGTGSGAIAVTLALELPGASVVATDVSPAALAKAKQNALALGVYGRNAGAGRVCFVASDVFDGFADGGRFDVVVSNPPYISREEWDGLPHEVANFEPRRALYGGVDGLDVVRRLVVEAERHLLPGGELVVEIGSAQGCAMSGLPCGALVFDCVSKDLAGKDRVARWTKSAAAS